MADGGPVVVGLALVGVDPRRIGPVRAGAAGVHVGEHPLEVLAVVLHVVDHPLGGPGVADDRVHRTEQRDVDRPDRTHRHHRLGHLRVEHRHQPGAAVAVGVQVSLELDEHDVGLVDPALRVLVLVVRHLDRHRGVLSLLRVLQQHAGQRPPRPGVDRGGRGWFRRRGRGSGSGSASDPVSGAGSPRGPSAAGQPEADGADAGEPGAAEPQQRLAPGDLRHRVLRLPQRLRCHRRSVGPSCTGTSRARAPLSSPPRHPVGIPTPSATMCCRGGTGVVRELERSAAGRSDRPAGGSGPRLGRVRPRLHPRQGLAGGQSDLQAAGERGHRHAPLRQPGARRTPRATGATARSRTRSTTPRWRCGSCRSPATTSD